MPPKEKWEHISIKASVHSINLETRKLTLRDPDAGLYTITVDPSVKRLGEVKEGDIISTDIYRYIGAEFRNPTLEELKTPIEILLTAAKVPEDVDPAGGVGVMFKAVVTIEAVSRIDMSVTVQNSEGDYTTFPIEDESLIQQLNVGAFVIITQAEAIVLSLEKQ